MAKIINYEEIEEVINKIESILKEEYDTQEQLLILNFVRQRISNNIQKQKVADTVNNHPLTRLANKFMKNKEED